MRKSRTSDEKRILCVGMCVLEIVHKLQRFPVEEEDRRCLGTCWKRGGNASNNCTVLRKLGVECEYLGMTSKSKAFSFLLDDCRQRGIHVKNCPSCDIDPPFSTVLLSQESGSRTVIHSNPNFPMLTHEHFRKLNLCKYKWIHFEGRTPHETLKMIRSIQAHNQCHNEKIKISVEIQKQRPQLLVLAEGVDYVVIGKDMAVFLGWNDAKAAVYGLHCNLKVEPKPAIICAWSGKGVDCIDADGKYSHCDSAAVSQGAFDTFWATTMCLLSRGQQSLAQALSIVAVTTLSVGYYSHY